MKRLKSLIVGVLLGAILLLSTLGTFAATTMYQGRVEISTTGTAVALGAAQEVDWIIVFADISNKYPITVGSSTVTQDGTSTDGPRIQAGESFRLGSSDRAEVYINGVDNDSAYYIAASGIVTAGLEVVQPTASELNATVVQGTASNLNATVTFATSDTYTSSGEKTSDTAIKASAGTLGGILIITDGTNDATLILYDDPDSADGTKLFEAVVAGGDNYGGVMFPRPVVFSLGAWGDIEGTGASYIVYYN